MSIVRLMPGFFIVLTLLAGCSDSSARQGCTNIVIDWVDALHVNGVNYTSFWHNKDVSVDLGPEVGRIQYTMADTVCDLSYRMKDGDATFLKKGTPVHAIPGYNSALVVTAMGRTYEAYGATGATGIDQIPFASGVRRIALLSEEDGTTELGAVEDPTEIDAFLQAALQAPVGPDAGADWDVFLEFQMADGLRFQRNYSTETGIMRRGIILSESARQIVLDALQ